VKKLLVVIGLAMLMLPSAFAGELIVNGGFESGDLSPWFNAKNFCAGTCVNWVVTNTNPHSGTFSAVDTGNIELRQNFTPTPGSQITNASFWIDSQSGLNAFDLFYTDGTDAEFVVTPTANVWTFEDVTSFVDPSKILMGFSVYGASPDFVTYLDDVSITSSGGSVPEPASLLMLGSGLLAVAGSIRRKLIS
jgi:PEP-CTERM motif